MQAPRRVIRKLPRIKGLRTIQNLARNVVRRRSEVCVMERELSPRVWRRNEQADWTARFVGVEAIEARLAVAVEVGASAVAGLYAAALVKALRRTGQLPARGWEVV